MSLELDMTKTSHTEAFRCKGQATRHTQSRSRLSHSKLCKCH